MTVRLFELYTIVLLLSSHFCLRKLSLEAGDLCRVHSFPGQQIAALGGVDLQIVAVAQPVQGDGEQAQRGAQLPQEILVGQAPECNARGETPNIWNFQKGLFYLDRGDGLDAQSGEAEAHGDSQHEPGIGFGQPHPQHIEQVHRDSPGCLAPFVNIIAVIVPAEGDGFSGKDSGARSTAEQKTRVIAHLCHLLLGP